VKEYDFIFSLGASCAVTMSLRDAGLQFASWPLDWTGSPGLMQSCAAVECGFENWFEREDLMLWDVRHEDGGIQRVYRNMRTRFGFPHEFTNAHPIEREFEKAHEKYRRRIARLDETLRSARRVLAIYLEVATRLPQDLETVRLCRRRLAAKYPDSRIDLMYVYERPDCAVPTVTFEDEGLVLVAAHYGKFLDGVPMHTVDRSQLVAFLRDRFTVAGHDGAAEKARYEAEQKKLRQEHWGKGRFERQMNRRLFKTYRFLQDYLIGQRLLPGDRPCWFEKEDRIWHHPEGAPHDLR